MRKNKIVKDLEQVAPYGDTCFYCDYSSFTKPAPNTKTKLDGFAICTKSDNYIDRAKFFSRNHKCHISSFKECSEKRLLLRIKHVVE